MRWMMEGGQRGAILVINLNEFELLKFHQVEGQSSQI